MSRTHSIDIAGDPSARSAQSERHSWRLLSRTPLSVALRGDVPPPGPPSYFLHTAAGLLAGSVSF